MLKLICLMATVAFSTASFAGEETYKWIGQTSTVQCEDGTYYLIGKMVRHYEHPQPTTTIIGNKSYDVMCKTQYKDKLDDCYLFNVFSGGGKSYNGWKQDEKCGKEYSASKPGFKPDTLGTQVDDNGLPLTK